MNCCEDPMAMCRVVCPKPRRVAPPNLNTISLAPSRFHTRNVAESNDGADLLGLILGQDQYGATLASSPPFSLGSPPCRTQNPLVHDADFGVEKVTFIHETSDGFIFSAIQRCQRKIGEETSSRSQSGRFLTAKALMQFIAIAWKKSIYINKNFDLFNKRKEQKKAVTS